MVRMLPMVAASAIGALSAVGGYTFVYARGYSYMTNDPQACANCHVMEDHFSAWTKSSHRAVAVCNDCHTPPGLVPKYATKALNGFNHSVAFTTGRFHEPLRITPRNAAVTEQACRKCHQEIVLAIESQGRSISCIRCHATVGHQ
ncbi:MAG TPA: cytochrome c nitrite reductase small subunit [Vicinamibacterales bacterium]|nr:cytochrome c nitrite reductase small subunit [Vicinamibacterales bacterium]